MAAITTKDLAVNGGTPVRDGSRSWPAWPIWDEREEQALLGVLRSGVWGSHAGTQVREFEAEFARCHQARHGVCNVNGTASLEIALRAAGVGMGDEVIVPPYTFIATASSVLLVNGTPIFADIDPETYNLDPRAAEAAITPRTKAIIPVHIGGCPADMDAFTELARKHNLILIEDCAQAHAAAWNGHKVGSIGDMGTFSFQSSKNINAGEGGIIITNDEGYYERCWSVSNVGRVLNGAWYDHRLLGANYRMTEFQGALLRVQLTRLNDLAARRSENARFLSSELAKIPGIRPLTVDPRVTQHAYHLYIFRFDASHFGKMTRNEFVQALGAEGIPCSVGYGPLYQADLFRVEHTYASTQFDYKQVRCPVTERACAEEAVWIFQNMLLGTREDMQDIVDAVAKIQRAATD
ncbi:MAG TPA: DegT/DnrJ/EryC1/StrS family aminotransferase [Armatimonadota bacterium]|nr:DegT/DnrJ/EryC1/StrS family aminotransferase [Armatimonadota bacterium]